MIDDTDTNPGVVDAESAAEEVTAPESEVEGEEPETPEVDPDDELEDFDHDGKTRKLPKWAKPHLMMNRDYTQKTQEVAETRKSYEAKEAQHAERVKAFEQDIQEHAALHALRVSIAQYEQAVPQLRQQGQFDAANQRWQELMEMREAERRLQSGLGQKQEARRLEQERTNASLLKERDAYAAKTIQGFNPALLSKIQEYASSDGYTTEEVQSIRDGRFLKTLNDARLWNEHLAKAKAAAAKVKQLEQPEVRPTAVVTARKAPSRLSDDMPIEKWAEMRNKQVAARDR